MRLVGLIFVFLTGCLIGIQRSAQLKKRVRILRLLQSMVNDLGTQLRFQTPTVWELLSFLCAQELYQPLGFLGQVSDSERFFDGWRTAVEQDFTLQGEEKQLLTELGSVLGTTDTEGQLSALELIGTRLCQLTAEAQQSAEEKGKLYRALGILGGAAAAVVLA